MQCVAAEDGLWACVLAELSASASRRLIFTQVNVSMKNEAVTNREPKQHPGFFSGQSKSCVVRTRC